MHIGKGTNADDGAVTFIIGGSAINTRQSTITKNNVGSNDRALEIRAATGNSHETIKLFSDNTTERIRIGQSGQIGLGGANYGTSGQVLTSQGGSAAPQWGDVAAGMSEYDVWAITNNTGASEWDYEVIGGGSAPASITIARQTTTQNPLFTKIGTGMSYSAGIWTFPSTGHWECTFTHIVQTQTAGTGQQYYMDVTQDNGTSWSPITFIFNTIGQGYGHTQTLIYNFLNVTNVGQQKVRYRWKSDGPCYSKGSTSDLRSSFVWKKVA